MGWMNCRFSLLLLAPAAVALIPPGLAAASTTCSDKHVAAVAIQDRADIRAYVECAAEYVREHGTEEARRAFHEDERWRYGPHYLFVRLLAIPEQGVLSKVVVFPPAPSREGIEGTQVHDIDDRYFLDYFRELHRVLGTVDAGWLHYFFTNPTNGNVEPKSSYVVEIDWDGQRVAIGAGIYERDLPGTCNRADVNAMALEADPSDQRLREFVGCAAMVVESRGYFAKTELEEDSRWSEGSVYVFVLDLLGNQIMSGSSVRVNGNQLHELGGQRGRTDQFGDRDVVDVTNTFGETQIYYRAFNPQAGSYQRKVGLLKRVVAQGIPVIVGAGYYLD